MFACGRCSNGIYELNMSAIWSEKNQGQRKRKCVDLCQREVRNAPASAICEMNCMNIPVVSDKCAKAAKEFTRRRIHLTQSWKRDGFIANTDLSAECTFHELVPIRNAGPVLAQKFGFLARSTM